MSQEELKARDSADENYKQKERFNRRLNNFPKYVAYVTFKVKYWSPNDISLLA